MHFEFLVEDSSGRIILEHMVINILGPNGTDHTYRFLHYKGIGHLPRNLKGVTDPKKRILLDRLPDLLSVYGKSLKEFPAIVVVVVDLDQRNCIQFKQELLDVLHACNPSPRTLFHTAIEEMEAWLLGGRVKLPLI